MATNGDVRRLLNLRKPKQKSKPRPHTERGRGSAPAAKPKTPTPTKTPTPNNKRAALQELSTAFGGGDSNAASLRRSASGTISQRQFKANVAQQRNVTAAAAESITATQAAVSAIQDVTHISESDAAKILRDTSKSIGVTQASLRGIAEGIQKRIAEGQSGSFDITRGALARKLGHLTDDKSIIQHVINTEIAFPSTGLNIDNTRRNLANSRRALGGKVK